MNAEIAERIRLIKEGKVPEGYKKNTIGIMPSEWKEIKLRNVNPISTGLTPLRSNKKYFEGTNYWIKTTDLNNSYIYDSEEKITDLALRETSLKIIERNSILIAMYGGFNQIGRTGITRIKCTSNQAISSFFIDEQNFNAEFVLHWLNNYRYHWKKIACSSRKDPNITKNDIENFPFVKLEYKEQKKISKIIDIWDKAITLKEKLIVEKEKQKQGLCERLLTGKVRIKGFDYEVTIKKLRNYIQEVKNKNKDNTETRILSVTNKSGFILQEEQFERVVASENLTGYKIVTKGQFAYNPSRVNVGSIDLLSSFESGLLSPMYVIFQCKDGLLKEYLNYFFKSNLFLNYIPKLLQGSVRESLSFNSLQTVPLFIPSINEQKAIAKILWTADKEINLLKKELNELKNQKKGLMQLLLTGIVRVKYD